MSGSFSDIINRKKKEWNAEGMMDGAKAERGPKIPFSSPLVNWATYGGIPRNKITEFCGEPHGGKSSTAIDVCKNAIELFQAEHNAKLMQLRETLSSGKKSIAAAIVDLEERGPKKVLYIDLEHSFDGVWSKVLGIDNDVLNIMQPPDVVAEDILQMIEDIIVTGEVGLIVLDSLPSLVPQKELDKKYGEPTVAALAGLLAVFCRKLVPLLTRYECTFLIINQIRDSLKNPYALQTPGGMAPKFYASLRILFRIGAPVDFLGNELPMNTENPAGHLINAKIIKQKSAPWDRKLATYYLMCNSGIRPLYDFAQLALKRYNLILKSGGWYTLSDPYTAEVIMKVDKSGNSVPLKLQGMHQVYDYLESNPEYYESLKTYILDDISNKVDNAAADDPSVIF